MIDAGERRLPTGPRGQGWIRQSRAVLPVVARLAGVEGVTGGELRGGGGFGRFWGLELRWFPIMPERWGGSARFRRVERWLQMDGGGSLERRAGPERGGGRADRRGGRRPSLVDCRLWER